MTASRSIPGWIREIVLINAVVYLGLGAGFLLFPSPLAGLFDIELRSPSALADLRAVYGGISLAVGGLFVAGLRRESWFAPSLFLAMTSAAALAFSRIYSSAVSGMPGTLVLAFLGLELLAFVWALLAYRALGAGTPDQVENLDAASSTSS